MSENKANIGPRIVLEGEAEYRQSISNVNKSMSVMKSELKAVSSEFIGNANSIDALRAKNEILMKQQTEQEKKMKLLLELLKKQLLYMVRSLHKYRIGRLNLIMHMQILINLTER